MPLHESPAVPQTKDEAFGGWKLLPLISPLSHLELERKRSLSIFHSCDGTAVGLAKTNKYVVAQMRLGAQLHVEGHERVRISLPLFLLIQSHLGLSAQGG